MPISDLRSTSVALVLAALGAGACSSSSGGTPNPASTTGGSTSTTSGAGGSGGVSTCDHVILSRDEFDIGFDPLALAAEGGKAYVLVDDLTGRAVRVAESGKLQEVARAPREEDFDLNRSNLLIDASGVFFDVHQDGKKWIFGAPRTAGAGVKVAQLTDSDELVDPPFVGDATSIFFVGQPGSYRAIMRVPRMPAEGPSPVRVSDADAFYNGLGALAVVESSVVVVDGTGMSYVARSYPKEPDMPPASHGLGDFGQSICGTFAVPPHIIAASDAIFLGCLEPGGAREAIYRLPPPAEWPANETPMMLGAPIAMGKIRSDSFVVAGSLVYFADYDQEAVFKVPAAGGTPTRVLGADGVEHMATDGTTLFVQGRCGIQSVPL